MAKPHIYHLTIKWTGNTGEGTSNYQQYERSHLISADLKPEIPASSDPHFRGDKTRYNPEELLVASLSSCHMLWYLHLCAVKGVVVVDYIDLATGTMELTPDGSGSFTEVVLNPIVTVSDTTMITAAESLHAQAHKMCFIANSVKFPVLHQPKTNVA